ncbi:hypothetical protein O181_118855 [Austropuccinia psidii MF-1]|uniref:Integrase catalytic domain-containing protein n=1 Tax=Austropuccinia psidii MF-1 TaxID=1389203 RepID=A0A9Q3PZS6_9BASI|nr:hypothetical protein [Austropuccinia psidii MF-1]
MYVDYSLPRVLLSIDLTTLWHNRLGHPGPMPAKLLGLPSGIIDCMTYNLKKAHCLPFSNHFEQSHLPLDCVHIELVGPISPPSVLGFQYFLTIIDQLTSFKIFQFLKSKLDAFSQFLLIKKSMENHHDRTLKKLVSYCGGEFVNVNFNDLSRDCGFKHVFAPPETPQQNGFSERENRTILEKACCMLGASNIPRSYWAEAVNTATILSNILPTPSRLNKSPYTLWTEEPDSAIREETHLEKEPTSQTGASQSLNEDHCAPSDQEEAPCEEEGPIPDLESEMSPATQSKIRVIGPFHATLITSEIDNLNILLYSKRANALVTCKF